ncbi:MAG: hypothetical protein AAFR16_03305, partial [Pseudomonadota bacterium]
MTEDAAPAEIPDVRVADVAADIAAEIADIRVEIGGVGHPQPAPLVDGPAPGLAEARRRIRACAEAGADALDLGG